MNSNGFEINSLFMEDENCCSISADCVHNFITTDDKVKRWFVTQMFVIACTENFRPISLLGMDSLVFVNDHPCCAFCDFLRCHVQDCVNEDLSSSKLGGTTCIEYWNTEWKPSETDMRSERDSNWNSLVSFMSINILIYITYPWPISLRN